MTQLSLPWDKEAEDFLIANLSLPRNELVQAINTKFNLDYTLDAVQAKIKRYNRSGTDQSRWTNIQGAKDLVKLLWTERGLSFSQIAVELGRQYGVVATRSAIAGWLARAGLNRKDRPRAMATPKDTKTKKLRRPKIKIDLLKAEPIDVELVETVAPASPVTFMELEAGHCRWPISDTHYCGTLNSFPYCAHHHERSYTPPRPRRPFRP